LWRNVSPQLKAPDAQSVEGGRSPHPYERWFKFREMQDLLHIWYICSRFWRNSSAIVMESYVKLLIKDTIKITEDMLSVHNTETITQQIIILLKTILEQNYFTFLDNTYKPEKGVSMGSPLSSTIAEIVLQHLEQIPKANSRRRYLNILHEVR
jgi:hypothetical protein